MKPGHISWLFYSVRKNIFFFWLWAGCYYVIDQAVGKDAFILHILSIYTMRSTASFIYGNNALKIKVHIRFSLLVDSLLTLIIIYTQVLCWVSNEYQLYGVFLLTFHKSWALGLLIWMRLED